MGRAGGRHLRGDCVGTNGQSELFCGDENESKYLRGECVGTARLQREFVWGRCTANRFVSVS